MTIHILQHVHFEQPGFILQWAAKEGISLSYTRFYEDDRLPKPSEIDGLIIMGGPMGVYDEEKIPWLGKEKAFIKSCIEARLPVLGICLGAQLIAEILGSRVYRHTHQEIGWFPITWASEMSAIKNQQVFHWHGDTYDLPVGATHLCSSEGCLQQAFVYDNHVLALQFHLEVGREEVKRMLAHDADDIGEGLYIQEVQQMTQVSDEVLHQNKMVLFEFLRKLFIDVAL